MKTPTLADPNCTMASSMCHCFAPRLGKSGLPEVPSICVLLLNLSS